MYGWHFNKKMCEWASSKMYKGSGEKKEYIEPFTNETFDKIKDVYGIKIDAKGYDDVYIANMCKADFLGSSIKGEIDLVRYVKDVIDDPDAWLSSLFSCFKRKMCSISSILNLKLDIYLEKYDWSIRVYYAVNEYFISNILIDLLEMDCNEESFFKIKRLMESEANNIGFTYTNTEMRASLMLIGITDSSEEFQDTFDHEKGHLVMHIINT